MGFQVLVVRGGDDFGFDGALKIGDLLRALVNQQDQRVHFRMVGRKYHRGINGRESAKTVTRNR